MTADPIYSSPALSAQFTLPGLAGRMRPLIASVLSRQPVKHAALQRTYEQLIDPLRLDLRFTRISDSVEVSAVKPGSAGAALAAAMLDWGYCSHYYTGRGEPELPPEPTILRGCTHTLVANLALGHTSVMLATLQAVIGPTVPALSLFGGVDTRGHAMVGELRRFSVSPLMEVVSDDYSLDAVLRDYRAQLYRELYTHSLNLFRAAGVDCIYGIATPENYRFFARSGIPMRRLDGVSLSESADVRDMQHQFARFWRPYAPKEHQPTLYRILYPTQVFVP